MEKQDVQTYMGFELKCRNTQFGVECMVYYKGFPKPYLRGFAQFSDGPDGAIAKARRNIEKFKSE